MLRLCRGTCQTNELTHSGYMGTYSSGHIHDLILDDTDTDCNPAMASCP